MILRWLLVILVAAAIAAGGTAAFWIRELAAPLTTLDVEFAEALGALASCIAATTVYLVIRWFRWHFLVRRFTRSVVARDSFTLYFATLPALLTPFNVGELIRVVALRARYRTTTGYLLLVWVLERFFNLGTLVALLLLPRHPDVAATTVAIVCVAGFALQLWLAKYHPSRPLATFLPITMMLTLAMWTLPVAALGIVLMLMGHPLPATATGAVFASGAFSGGLSGMPLGAGVTSSIIILELVGSGVAESTAIVSTALFRMGTAWFAAALGLVLLAAWRRELLTMLRRPTSKDHFDSIANEYETLIPPHVRDRLVQRKIGAMLGCLDAEGIGPGARGLDVGCGQGGYVVGLAQRGYAMSGVEQSAGQLAHARAHATAEGVEIDLHETPADRLPFADGELDFAYVINVVHHIQGREARERALAEIVRCLRPGGVLFMHEINTQNPAFRFYMGYLFPLLRKIDDGTEEWILPTVPPVITGQTWHDAIVYFTFLPEFIPPALLERFAGLERALELSRLKRYSAHFMRHLVKQ